MATLYGSFGCFLVVAFKLGGRYGGAFHGQADRFDGVMGGYMDPFVRVAGGSGRGANSFEFGPGLPVWFLDAGQDCAEGFAGGFTVPAGAFGVRSRVHVLILFRSPFESFRKFVFVDLVVMVDEDTSLVCRVYIVLLRGELVGVPSYLINISRSLGNRTGVKYYQAKSTSSVGTTSWPGCLAKIAKYLLYFSIRRRSVEARAGECIQSIECIFSMNVP